MASHTYVHVLNKQNVVHMLFFFCRFFSYIKISVHQENMSVKPHFSIAKLGYAGVYLFFLFFLQNIDCGYSSNVYPQSMF